MEKLYDEQAISRNLLDTIEQFNKYDKKARFFGTDHELFIAEIHLIDFIGNNKNCCISEIAKSIQVTKGAVSQMVKKLEKKGYLRKIEDSDNKTKVIVQLTEKGQTAFDEHRRYHKNFNKKILEGIKNFDAHQRKAICEFLQEIQKNWK